MILEKTFDPKQSEDACYERWEKKGYFKANPEGNPAYCIMIPPPNVTGTLHMGHAFQQTLMDILIRYHRMKGHQTLWQVGTDHAGIATQMVVERQLMAQGQSKHDLGREAFIEQIWAWKEKSGKQITQQIRRMGASVDWETERFTLDEGLSKAVTAVFIQLYHEGLIYRGKRLVNWDPVLQTAVSDLEVVSEEEEGSLWHIRYPFAPHAQKKNGQPDYLVIATTRPETLLGDTALAVHPEDPRYQAFIGQSLQLPLTDRLIPIIADPSIDPDFGSGCVKITPAHDFNDYALAKKHALPMLNILDEKAHLNSNVPLPYQGLERFEARQAVLRDLRAQNLLEKTENHRLRIPRGDKSGAILEPLLTDQWFVKVESLAKEAIQAVESGEIRFVPDTWSKTYFEWMHKIEDWCISRQLWWGHRIPAWFDDAGNLYVDESEDAVRARYQLPASTRLTQDNDVLDTWFSSALWPFSTLGWPNATERLNTFYPTQVLVTGFDIIFFWVARMIMFGLKFTGHVPFQEVYIHGLIQDHLGQKMSKTKGNGIDPLDVIDGIDLDTLLQKRTQGLMQPQLAASIEKETRRQFPNGIPAYGTDALRFTFAALATPSRHIRFEIKRVEGYKHFCNKIWNAARYVLMNTESMSFDDSTPLSLSVADRWIQSEWQTVKERIESALAQYRFDWAAQALYEFIWNEYCDWYLEFSKPLLQSSEERVRGATARTLLSILEEVLRVAHPFMPYISETIWQALAPLCNQAGESIMIQPYPEIVETRDEAASRDIAWLKTLILAIRTIRGEMNIIPSQKIRLLIKHSTPLIEQRLRNLQSLVGALVKVEAIDPLEGTPPKTYATVLVEDFTALLPLEGLIDVEAECMRLHKNIQKLSLEKTQLTEKLKNAAFLEKAPQELVATLSSRLTEIETLLEKLQKTLSALGSQKNGSQAIVP